MGKEYLKTEGVNIVKTLKNSRKYLDDILIKEGYL